MKTLFFLVVLGLVTLLPLVAHAQSLTVQSLDPFHFGPGALSGWQIGAGVPVSGGSDGLQYGLYLQKGVPTSSFAAAGADVVLKNPPAASSLTTLSFVISGVTGVPFGTANGYCGAGAPRWSVLSSGAPTCFLGCAHADKTQDATTGWWTIKFVAPFTQYPGCDGGLSGTISNLFIVLDEGTDVGPGNVVIDDITINTRVFRKP